MLAWAVCFAQTTGADKNTDKAQKGPVNSSTMSSTMVGSTATSVAGTGTNGVEVGEKTKEASGAAPSVVPPKFSAMRLRMSLNEAEKDSEASKDQKRHWITLGEARDVALQEAMSVSVSGTSISGAELKKLTAAQRAIIKVCNAGFDYIEQRMNKNATTSFWIGSAAAALGVGGAAAAVIRTSKLLTISSAGISAYKSDFLPSADTDHQTTSLKSIADDIRLELAASATDFSRWMFVPTPDKSAQRMQLQQLQASLIAANHACSFF
jgi:hypothetical protein